MIANNNLCICTHPGICLDPNANPYIEVRNNIRRLHVKFKMDYVYITKIYTMESRIFGFEEKGRIYFNPRSENVTLTIYENPGVEPKAIFRIFVVKSKTTCFKLTGTETSPKCEQIPC